jgi:hypothetical protein
MPSDLDGAQVPSSSSPTQGSRVDRSSGHKQRSIILNVFLCTQAHVNINSSLYESPLSSPRLGALLSTLLKVSHYLINGLRQLWGGFHMSIQSQWCKSAINRNLLRNFCESSHWRRSRRLQTVTLWVEFIHKKRNSCRWKVESKREWSRIR